MFQFVKKVIINFVSWATAIIAFIQFFGETNTYKELLSRIGVPNGIPIKYQIILGIVIFIIVIIWRVYSYNREYKDNEKAGKELHFFYHELRNTIFYLKADNNNGSYNDYTTYYKQVKRLCSGMCEKIFEFLKARHNKAFAICIKMLDVESAKYVESAKKKDDLDKVKVFTLCRAGENCSQREEIETRKMVNVTENTAFETILGNDPYNISNSIFACSNLIMLSLLGKILKALKYKSHTPQFWKYYQSTIVVPIQMEEKFVDTQASNKQNRNKIVAFLCIDYAKPISKALKAELVGYMQSFGDALYILFDEIIVGNERITEKIQKNTPKRLEHTIIG